MVLTAYRRVVRISEYYRSLGASCLTPANGLAKEGGASFISVLVFFCVKKLRGD